MTKTSMATEKPPPTAQTRVNKKLTASLAFGQLGSYLVWGAVPSVLLAVHLEDVDTAHKEANLALVVGLGALVSTVIQPVWGMASDRTRSRYGRRAPYLLAGALLGALGLLAVALANTVLTIALSWCVVQAAVTGANGVLHAVLPDRVPVAVRGTVSAALGAGTMLGILGGQILASSLVPHGLLLPYAVVATVLVASMAVFVVENPDVSSREAPRRPFHAKALLGMVWVSPRRHPDFACAFLGRLFLLLGYHTVGAYQLYILQDYVGLERAEALGTITRWGLTSMSTMLLALLVSGWLSDRINRRKPFVVASTLIIGVALGIPYAMPTVNGFLLYAAIGGFGFGCYQAVDTALISQVLPSAEDAAKDLGVAGLASHLPQILAPVLAGFIVVHLGGYATLFQFAFAVSVLGALCVLPIKSVR